MGARLTCSCSQSTCSANDDSSLRIDAEVFELSPDGQRWQRMDARLCKVRIFNGFDDSQARVVATSQTGDVIIDIFVPIGEKVHKVSEYFVYFRVDGRTIGLNTLSSRDTSLVMSHACNVSQFNMFQHSFTATVSRIATFEEDVIVSCSEDRESTTVSLNPLNMVFDYHNSPVSIDLLESFASSDDSQQSVDISHGNNIFRIFVPAHSHLFLVQALNISSLLLARTTSSTVAVGYLARQKEKVIETIANMKNEDTSSQELDMLLLKKTVIEQRLCALLHSPLPDYESIKSDISSEVASKLLDTCQLPSLFLYYFNMNTFRIWRKSIEVRQLDLDTLAMPSTSNDPLVTSHNGTTTFHATTLPMTKIRFDESTLAEACENRIREMGEETKKETLIDNRHIGEFEGEDYVVRKTNGRLGLTIYAHNADGIIKAEVRGVTSFAPRCAAVGDAVIGVDGSLIANVKCASDVEKLLRQGKVIHLRRKKALVKKTEEVKPKEKNKVLLALKELLVTEKKYVDDLKEMNDVFLGIRMVREIMHSALRLYKIQTSFVDSLEEAIGDVINNEASSAQMKDSVMRVCAVFVNRCGDLKIYAEYAASYLRLQQEIKHRKELLAKLEAVNSSKEQHCSYESRMIKPVQRIVQYPLLLKNILDASEKDAFERKQVEAALQKMQTLAEYVNEMQRLHEQYSDCIENVKRANEQMLAEKGVRIDTRDLLIFAHIRWTDAPAEHYVIFVFYTLILLLPSYARRDLKMKWTRVLPINEVDIDASSDGLHLRIMHAAFEAPGGQLSHSNPNTVYHIECCQPQLKQQLVKSIRKARANFVRESRRPLSGSSQSDGGYGSEVSKENNKNVIK